MVVINQSKLSIVTNHSQWMTEHIVGDWFLLNKKVGAVLDRSSRLVLRDERLVMTVPTLGSAISVSRPHITWSIPSHRTRGHPPHRWKSPHRFFIDREAPPIFFSATSPPPIWFLKTNRTQINTFLLLFFNHFIYNTDQRFNRACSHIEHQSTIQHISATQRWLMLYMVRLKKWSAIDQRWKFYPGRVFYSTLPYTTSINDETHITVQNFLLSRAASPGSPRFQVSPAIFLLGGAASTDSPQLQSRRRSTGEGGTGQPPWSLPCSWYKLALLWDMLHIHLLENSEQKHSKMFSSSPSNSMIAFVWAHK